MSSNAVGMGPTGIRFRVVRIIYFRHSWSNCGQRRGRWLWAQTLSLQTENVEQLTDEPAKSEELANVKEPAAETEAPRASRALEKRADGVL